MATGVKFCAVGSVGAEVLSGTRSEGDKKIHDEDQGWYRLQKERNTDEKILENIGRQSDLKKRRYG